MSVSFASASALAAAGAVAAAIGVDFRDLSQRSKEIEKKSETITIENLLYKMEAQLERNTEILEIWKRRYYLKQTKEIIENPQKYRFLLSGGVTLGDLLNDKVKNKKEFCKEAGISEKILEDLLKDKIFPFPELSKKLRYILTSKYGVREVDYFISIGNTYQKIKILSDKSIKWGNIKKKFFEKVRELEDMDESEESERE